MSPRSARPRRAALRRSLRRSLRRALARHRRLLSAGCLAGAAAVLVHTVSPPPPPGVTVWVAARDLPAGHRLTPGDLAASRWPPSLLPTGGVARPTGGWLAGPIRRGEPVTDTRLVGPGLLAGQPPGVVGLAVRLSDPAALIGVRAGSRVDVLAGPPGQGLDPAGSEAQAATALASAALVLGALAGGGAEPDAAAGSSGLLGGLGAGPLAGADAAADPAGGGVLVLAVDRETAGRIAAAEGTRPLTVAITGGP